MQTKKEEIRSIEQSLAVIENVRTDNDRLHAIRNLRRHGIRKVLTKGN